MWPSASSYKFELLGPSGTLLPLKADPYARAAQMRPATGQRRRRAAARAAPAGRARRRQRGAMPRCRSTRCTSGSWRRHPDGGWHSWDDLAAALPAYAADLGFTHLELLPITEHPFDGSWGYQTLGLYAPTARFGPPEGFARFVAACHAQGLGLILDWVPAHFPSDAFGLAQFDGTALYEYQDPREGLHKDWNTLIYNFGRHEVRNFLVGSALYWIERQGVDGLRVDAVASMLYRDYSRKEGEWLPNRYGGRENLEAIAFLRRTNEVIGVECPGAITLAEESTAFPGVSAPTYHGGLGFHFKWNMGWMHDTLKYMQEDPINRRWHHAKMTFGLIYAFSENFVLPLSHDEVVHGKGSILGRMPGDDWQRFANLRAYYGFMWGHPGKKLLFMGQEWGQPGEWNHDGELPWGQLGDARHAGVQRLVRDLNRLYRDLPPLHRLDCEGAGFEWIDAHDAERSLLSWVRRDGAGAMVLVVSNMTPVPREAMTLGVPEGAGAWREVLNTDSAFYGGSNVGQRGRAAGRARRGQPRPRVLDPAERAAAGHLVPGSCVRRSAMDPNQRASGVLLHITSLPGPHGIGDFGPGAHHFVDWLHTAGQRLWQVLPLTPIGPGDSPYQSVSAFAGSPLMVALEPLVERGWLSLGERAGLRRPARRLRAACPLAHAAVARRRGGLCRPRQPGRAPRAVRLVRARGRLARRLHAVHGARSGPRRPTLVGLGRGTRTPRPGSPAGRAPGACR